MTVTNLVALQFCNEYYQGGTIHQMVKLRVDALIFLNANDERMDDLLRRAQGLHVGKDYIKKPSQGFRKSMRTYQRLNPMVTGGCILPLSTQVIDRLHPDAIPEDCDHDGLCLGSSWMMRQKVIVFILREDSSHKMQCVCCKKEKELSRVSHTLNRAA